MTKEDFVFFSEIYLENHKVWFENKFICLSKNDNAGYFVYKGLLDANDKWYNDLKRRFENQE